jgi:hypothetical protein
MSTTEELLDRKVAAPVYKTENMAVGIRHADHVAPSIRKKLAITSPTSGGRSDGIVRLRTQTMEFFLTQSVGLLRRGISTSQGFYLHSVQHKQRLNTHTDINALSGIRTHDPSV